MTVTRLALSAAALALALPLAALARDLAMISDGDTVKQGGNTYRLWGIDAPEAKQTCPDGWPAGRMAATKLQALTTGRSIVCQEKDRDRYGRIVAVCRASGEDLGAIMVRDGMAWAFLRYSSDYVSQERRRRLLESACMHKSASRPGIGGRSSADDPPGERLTYWRTSGQEAPSLGEWQAQEGPQGILDDLSRTHQTRNSGAVQAASPNGLRFAAETGRVRYNRYASNRAYE